MDTRLCVGLDPEPRQFPGHLRDRSDFNDSVFEFNKAIIDATVDLTCCYKPQFAHFAALGAELALERTIRYIQDNNVPVLLDVKRGDIGSTAEKYAIEAFERYGADAATINPYLGYDAMAPYLAYKDKGIFILCRTSNEGGRDLQNLVLDNGRQLFEHVAEQASSVWNSHGNVALVTGATHARELRCIREITGQMTFLLPGIGAQGGDIAESLSAGQGGGLIISSSRAILYASSGPDFAQAARVVAEATRNEIRAHQLAA